MALNDEVQQAWSDHGRDPGEVASRLSAMVNRAEEADAPLVAGLVVHLLGEHLGRWEDGLQLLHGLIPRVGSDPANVGSLYRAIATMRLCAGDSAEVEALLSRLGADRQGSEARVLAMAASAVGAHGRTTDAARWLVRAASMAYGLPDDHPAVQAIAITGNNLAVTLEERAPSSIEEASLLRSAAQLARAAWERAGTWLEVQRAEYRLTMTSLVLAEPYAAVAHAEACALICAANRANPIELLYANEAKALALHAYGDTAAARAAREVAAGLLPQVDPGMVEYARQAMARLDARLAAGR